MSHNIKNIGDYLILTDLNCLFIIEKETFQIIATYDTDGEATAICHNV